MVNVKSLESTLVSNTPIYYSRVDTKYPQFGFTVRNETVTIKCDSISDKDKQCIWSIGSVRVCVSEPFE